MAKKVYKVEAFEGGLNQKADPRDIEDNQFEELFNADVSRKGRITLPGNALSTYSTTNILGGTESPSDNPNSIQYENGGLTSGYGLFAFAHDYNMRGLATGEDYPDNVPNNLETDFICINDGAAIDIWDSCHTDDPSIIIDKSRWINKAIQLGSIDRPQNLGKIKATYYKADNGLRACDGTFGYHQTSEMKITNDPLTSTGTALTTNAMWATSDIGSYIQINSEVMLITAWGAITGVTVKRGQFGTKAQAHAVNSTFKIINIPKILTHINRPLLEKAEGASGANSHISRWVEDIQFPEPPDEDALTVYENNDILGGNGTVLHVSTEYPLSPEKVFLSLNDTVSESDTYHLTADVTEESGSSNEPICVLTLGGGNLATVGVAGAGFAIGKAVRIENAGITDTDGSALNGIHEIVGFGNTKYKIKIAADLPGSTYTVNASSEGQEAIMLEETVMSDDLKNKYIFGMSYLYNGGSDTLQESDITVGYKKTPLIKHNYSHFLSTVDHWHVEASGAENNLASLDHDLTGTEQDGWQWAAGNVAYMNGSTGSDNGVLAYLNDGDLLADDTKYVVSIKFGDWTDADSSLVLRLGYDGSASSDTAWTQANNDGNKRTFTEEDANSHYVFNLSTPASGSTLSNIVVISAASSPTVKIEHIQIWKAESKMTAANAVDFRSFIAAGKSQFSFLCNNSRSGNTQNNSWSERIEGFRIYMKQVDMIGGGLTEDWLLFADVNLRKGTYIAHAKDGDEEFLQLANPVNTANDWSATSTDADTNSLVTSNVAGDIFKEIPLLSYESENGYPAGTNLAAMYKTSAIVNRKVYIGNIKIGDESFPDRMIKADADKFDSFPSDGAHYIDVAASDGDSIVKLESFGDALIQFKKRTAYLIKIDSETEDLADTWHSAGILSPSQVVKTKDGIVWVNNNGLFFYNGEKLQHVTDDRFTADGWAINENEATPVLLGYDEKSNKVIIQTLNTSNTDSGGFIYDMVSGAISQCQKLFNWYVTDESLAGPDTGVGPVKYTNKTDSGDDQTAGSGTVPVGPDGKSLSNDEVLGGG